MLLAIDIGNTNIVIGCIKDDQILFKARIATDRTRTSDQYGVEMKNMLEAFGIRYGYVTTSIPVCCSMMILTCITKIFKLITHFNDDEFTLKKDAADAKLGEENMGVGETPVEL